MANVADGLVAVIARSHNCLNRNVLLESQVPIGDDSEHLHFVG